MNVAAGNAMYVGNDMHRDIFGAREAGPDDGDVRFRPGEEGLPGLRARLHDHVLKKLGFSHMSARPRHPAQDERIVEAFKKTSRAR